MRRSNPMSDLHTRITYKIAHLHSPALAPGAHLPWRAVPGSVRQVQVPGRLQRHSQ